MFSIVIIILCTIILAREISGYDSRYNNRKYFTIKNKTLAKILLPKTLGSRRNVKRAKADFNKMTYIGAIFYLCNFLLLLSIPIFLFLVPEIQIKPFELNAESAYISVDTLNEKLPLLFSFILLAVEGLFEILSAFIQAKKENIKWLTVLSAALIIIMILFILLQIKEIISTFIEVLL